LLVSRRSRFASISNALFVRIDGEHRRRRARELNRQPPLAAPELEHVQSVNGRELSERPQLDSLRVDPPGHERIFPGAPAGVTSTDGAATPGSGEAAVLSLARALLLVVGEFELTHGYDDRPMPPDRAALDSPPADRIALIEAVGIQIVNRCRCRQRTISFPPIG
jgi:hypothetical protein